MTKEKKKTIIITSILSIVALALIACFAIIELNGDSMFGSTESAQIVKEFNKYYNATERKVIFFASSNCVWCDKQKPILETIAKDYEIDYFSVDNALLSGEDRTEIIEKLGIEGRTPTIVIVESGKVVATSTGYKEGKSLINFFKENKIVPEDAIYSQEKHITYIDYNKYKNLIRNDKTNIIVIGASSCGNCTIYKPAINSVAEDYELTFYYLDLDELTEDESNAFFESLKKIEYNDPDFLKDGSFGTPLTIIVKNGKIKNYISGAQTYSKLTRELTKAGIIEE